MSRIEELEDENTMLREALGLTFWGDPTWPLSKSERKLLGVLSRVQVASQERLMTALYADTNDPPADKVIMVRITNIRRKLKPYGIEIKNRWGQGYWLTPESREIIRATDDPPETYSCGHPRTSANTTVHKKKSRCRACHQKSSREYMRRRRAAA